MNDRLIMNVLFFSIGLIVSSTVSAQNPTALKGKVSDIDSGENLSFASISIMGKPLGTVTIADGEFEFHLKQNRASPIDPEANQRP